MNRIFSFALLALFLLAGTISQYSCKPSAEKEITEDEEKQAISDSIRNSEAKMVYYTFPSSQEMFTFIKKDAKLVYRTDLVNPPENYPKYIDTRSKTFALGVYLADLSYMTLFNKTTSAYNYIGVITSLSDQLRINMPFQQEFLKRVANNLNNEDSLVAISDAYSVKIIDYLLKNKKDKTLASITTGSYIEGLYIALNLAGTYTENNQVIQRIVEQKYSFMNLIRYAKEFENDENTKTAIAMLSNIYRVFEKFVEEGTGESVIVKEEDKMMLKGGKKIILTESSFIDLKKVVTEQRNKIIENNY